MKRILINATHNEEVRVALCKGNHLYDFDLENRTREQKKSNIYKGHVTRVEPSLEAVFVEYGSKRQGFLPIREIANNYLSGNPREENIRKLIKEGDELIVQVEKEERGNKGAALSTYVSLAGRYLVLMPNNPKGGGISRQISGKLREDMKRMLGNLDLAKGMSVIIRTAGIGKTQEDLQHDLNHLLNIWNAIQQQNKKYPSPRLVHQEAGVVTRAVRDYLRDDVSEIWIDNEDAFIEAETFVKAVMPKQLDKLRKYTEFEPMFASFGVERQIETAYQREVRLPSGGSIVIDQTEALVSIDINSAKSTKGADVSETAYHTNLEAADEIARQLRLRDMGGLIVIDFIDMNDSKHQKEVEKRLVDATKYDRARVQFGDISRFGLMEMSRQRLRPSLEESTGYICPRCHGNGMIRDLRSLSLSIMRQIEQTALKERHGEVQCEVPTDIAAFLLNEKRESLVYLEQDSGTRITILPHAHLESPNFNLHFNHQGFAPSSYERVTDTQQQENTGRGYEVDWQTAETERPEHQPTRQPRDANTNYPSKDVSGKHLTNTNTDTLNSATSTSAQPSSAQSNASQQHSAQVNPQQPAAVAWLSNLFAPTPQAKTADTVSSADAAKAIEAIVNTGAQSRGLFGEVAVPTNAPTTSETSNIDSVQPSTTSDEDERRKDNDKNRQRSRGNNRNRSKHDKRGDRNKSSNRRRHQDKDKKEDDDSRQNSSPRHDQGNETRNQQGNEASSNQTSNQKSTSDLPKREPNSRRDSRGAVDRNARRHDERDTENNPSTTTSAQVNGEAGNETRQGDKRSNASSQQQHANNRGSQNSPSQADNIDATSGDIQLKVTEAEPLHKEPEIVHISLTDSVTDSKVDPATDSSAGSKPSATVVNDVNVKTDAESDDSKQQSTQAENAEVTKRDTKPTSTSAQASPSVPTKETAEPKTAVTAASKKELGSYAATTINTSKEEDASSLGFDSASLFADRYVTAKKFGQASNDPRLVKTAMQRLKANNRKVGAKSQATAKSGVVRINKGAIAENSVGEFIHTHLANASIRLQKDGVIRCFLAALNAHRQTSGLEPVTNLTIAAVIPEPVFNFVNYGYEPLTQDYLQRFHTMTTAVDKVAIEAGKVEIQPAAIGVRAKNDPRGQHPDYQPAIVSDDINTKETADSGNTNPTASATVEDSSNGSVANDDSAQGMSALLQLNTGEFINQVLGQEGIDLIASGQTEAAFLKALAQPLPSFKDSTEQTASALADTSQVDEVNATSEAAVETARKKATQATMSYEDADQQADQNITKAAEHDSVQAESEPEAQASDNPQNKTSIESYKSMIENISEQLLPQTGLLKLSSVKAPKVRRRKVKDGAKNEATANDAKVNKDDEGETQSDSDE